MKKEKYERTDLDVIRFKAEDIILTSEPDYEDDETPLMPGKTEL